MAVLDTIIQIIVNGLSKSMLTFLAAVGLTMIFGILGIINFAHGSFYMLGAYFLFFAFSLVFAGVFGGFWIAVLVSILLVAAVGGIIERFIIRPIYDHDHIFQLLLTFALVLLIDNGVRFLWGTSFRSIRVPSIFAGQVQILGSGYPIYNLFVIITGFVVAAAMWYLFSKTRLGKTVRAAAQDRETANALGINVPFLFTTVFIFGSALAGLGGALAAPYSAIHPAMGESIIIDSFIVVIIGGLGSFPGAFVGALILGLSDSIMFNIAPSVQPYVPFVLLAGVIILRPRGIFGEGEA